MNTVALMFIIFVVGIAISLPIGITLGVTSMAGILAAGSMDLEYFARTLVTSLDNFPLLAVALFILSGDLMVQGGIARKLFEVAHLLVGRFTAGHCMAAILTCIFFGAISGSGPATVAAIGGLMIPMLTQIGYNKVFATALLAAAGGLGVIIPPSIPMIMYGVVTGVSVSDLFMAGVIPGFVVGGCLMLYSYIYIKVTKPVLDPSKIESGKSPGAVLIDSIWAIMFPVIILGGIYGGIFTPTEAAGVSVIYALIISLFIYKTIKMKDVWGIFLKSAATLGPLMIIVSTATVFGRILTIEQLPQMIAEFITNISTNPVMVILIINVFLLIVGALMDTVAAILILAPILLPITLNFGFNPVHFGIIMVVSLAIGFITPPIGMNLYVASGITGLSIETISSKLGWILVAVITALMLVTFIPELSLFLLRLL